MATFKAEVIASQRKKDGTWNVKIRVTHNGSVRRLSTPWFVDKDGMTKGYKLKEQSIIDAAEKAISRYRARLIELGMDANEMSIDRLIAYLTANDEATDVRFFDWAYKFVDKKGGGKHVYLSTLNTFREWCNLPNLTFSDITGKMLRQWVSEMPAKTAANKVPRLRHIFEAARKELNDEDNGNIVIKNNPFQNVELPKAEAPRKRAVPAETLQMIARMEDEKRANSVRNKARDFFIISFCLIGMNAADIYECKPIKNGAITYNRRKTRGVRADGAFIKVDVPDFVLPFIERWKDPTGRRLFRYYMMHDDLLVFDNTLNVGTKKVADELVAMYREEHKGEQLKEKDIRERLKIENLTPYAARHSWATIARNQCRIDKYTIHEALNHVDKDTRIDDVYIDKDFTAINEANNKVIEYVFGK